MINNVYREWPATKGDVFLDDKEQSISNYCFYAQNGLARPEKNLSWLFPSQMMNSYVQECLVIQPDIFRQRMKHSTSNYCYFAQNNVAHLKKSIMTPPPSKNGQLNLNGKITSHIECQTFDICHWMANGDCPANFTEPTTRVVRNPCCQLEKSHWGIKLHRMMIHL